MKVFTFASLFAGIGGFDLALERCGFTPRWQCEIDPTARSVLTRHWPDVRRFEDVRTIDASAPPVDVLCGGWPCQDLSVAGNRAGLAGERSGLFVEIVRLARDLAPRWLLLENVPGLLSSHEGRDMGAVLWSLGELGYRWAYRVLDAQFFGVPQRRRRVFIVASLGAGCPSEVLLEPEGVPGDSAAGGEEGASTAAVSAGGAQGRGWRVGADEAAGDQIVARTITTREGRRFDSSGETYVIGQFDGHSADRIQPETRVANTLDTDGLDGIVIERCLVRRLTPRECERLQGFPDDWTRYRADGSEIADSACYRMIGNSVAVPVVEWIARRIAAA